MQDNALIAIIINTLVAGEATAGIPGTPVKQAFQPTAQGANAQPTAYLHKLFDRRYGFLGRSDVWKPVQSAAFTGSVSGTVLTVSALASGNINVGDVLSGDGVPLNTMIVSEGTGSGGLGTYNLSATLSASSEAMTTATLTMVHTETQQYETTFQLSVLATQNPATPTQYTASDICNLCASILQSAVSVASLQAQGVGIERITDVRNPPFLDDRAQFEYSPNFDFCLTHKQIVASATPILLSEEVAIYSI